MTDDLVHSTRPSLWRLAVRCGDAAVFVALPSAPMSLADFLGRRAGTNLLEQGSNYALSVAKVTDDDTHAPAGVDASLFVGVFGSSDAGAQPLTVGLAKTTPAIVYTGSSSFPDPFAVLETINPGKILADWASRVPPASSLSCPTPPMASIDLDESRRDFDELAIYELLLRDEVKAGKAQIIESMTEAVVAAPQKQLSQVLATVPCLSVKAFASFFQRNVRPSSLQTTAPVPKDWRVLAKETINKPFRSKSPDGWEVFRQRYPDSNGSVRFSRVGFSDDGAQAIVYVDYRWGWVGGEGYLYVLQKSATGWQILYRDKLWVS